MNIVLISANSYRLIAEEIKKITQNNYYLTMNMNSCSMESLLEEASYLNLVEEKKYVVASNASFFGSGKLEEKELAMFEKYLSNPNPNTILIFTTLDGIDSRKKIVKQIKDKYTLINITPWDKKKCRLEAEKYLKESGYRIDYNTLTYVLENTFNNVDILYNELDKIMLYYNGGCTIKYEDITEIIGKEKDSNNFHFVSAVIEKDLEKSIEIMNGLKIYKVEPIVLISMLAREYRLMYYVMKMKSRNDSVAAICENLKIQEWQATKLYTNSLKYKEEEILKNIYILGKIDLNIKNGTYDKDISLYSFLLEVCA